MNKTASPPKLMPNLVRWKKIAPHINPNPIKAPNNVVRGIKINSDAASSAIPVPILPQGSISSVVKSCTDCGCAVNLKYNVCKSNKAAMMRNAHVKIVLIILAYLKCNFTLTE